MTTSYTIENDVDENGKLVPDNFTEPVPACRVKVNGVWFNALNMGKTKYSKMSDVPKRIGNRMKDNIKEWSDRDQFIGRELHIRAEGDRQVVYSNGSLLGYVDKHHHIDSDYITVVASGSDDGNLTVVYS